MDLGRDTLGKGFLNLVYPNHMWQYILEIERRRTGRASIAPSASSITTIRECHCCKLFLSLSPVSFSLRYLWFGFQLFKAILFLFFKSILWFRIDDRVWFGKVILSLRLVKSYSGGMIEIWLKLFYEYTLVLELCPILTIYAQTRILHK